MTADGEPQLPHPERVRRWKTAVEGDGCCSSRGLRAGEDRAGRRGPGEEPRAASDQRFSTYPRQIEKIRAVPGHLSGRQVYADWRLERCTAGVSLPYHFHAASDGIGQNPRAAPRCIAGRRFRGSRVTDSLSRRKSYVANGWCSHMYTSRRACVVPRHHRNELAGRLEPTTTRRR